jgi:hypothetical protein
MVGPEPRRYGVTVRQPSACNFEATNSHPHGASDQQSSDFRINPRGHLDNFDPNRVSS